MEVANFGAAVDTLIDQDGSGHDKTILDVNYMFDVVRIWKDM